MISPAFKAAERARRKFEPASKPQRRTLAQRSREAGIVLPRVRTKTQATDALNRLEDFLTRPQLEGLSASTSSASSTEGVVG